MYFQLNYRSKHEGAQAGPEYDQLHEHAEDIQDESAWDFEE